MSPVMKSLLLAAGVVLVVAYVAVVELGINAGRIHFGVTVRGMDVGGLTVEEAVQRLQGRAALLDSKPLVLGSQGVGRVSVFPSDLRWMAKAEKTAAEAAAVGRDGDLFTAVSDRVVAYLDGIDVPWEGGPRPRKVSKLINQIEKRVAEDGLDLDRARLRGKIKRLVQKWPRARWYRIPVSR
jgi:hypothetical protein